ncbi:MAG: hypothetical protein Q9167_005780 [Letrouitia subvulpina]
MQEVEGNELVQRLVPTELSTIINIIRLEKVTDDVNQILNIFGSSSCSIGVLHHNQDVFINGFGVADKKAGRVPDKNTLYCMGSCTKAFTALALVLLARQNGVQLSAPLSEILPELSTPYNPEVANAATLADALSHCTGLASLLYALMGKQGAVLTKSEDVIHDFNNLPCVASLRSEWRYNNWPFALAARIVDRKSGRSWESYVSEIFEKLHLARTCTRNSDNDNHARAYMVLSDDTLVEATLPSLRGGDAFDGSGSLRSCVSDMLIWCKSLLAASDLPMTIQGSDFEIVPRVINEYSHTPGMYDLLQAMKIIQQPRCPLESDLDQSYGLGLFSLHLPSTSINSVTNAPQVTKSYILGAESSPRPAIGHTGDLGGFLSAYWTFPETKSAVVVMCNSTPGNGDPSNIIAELLIQALVDLNPKIDLVEIAKQANKAAKSQWDDAVTEWAWARQLKTRHKPLDTYAGV